MEHLVEFYDAFHKTAIIYLLPVMPFDCISIKMGFEALCPPGLGISRYAMISRVLMELLPRLLPRSDTQISSLINMVRMESGNGFDLLWRVMALSVPGFDPTCQDCYLHGMTMTSLTLPCHFYFISDSRQKKARFRMIGQIASRSLMQLLNLHMPMLLLHS